MIYKFFDRKTSGSGIKNESIWQYLADFVDMQSISKFNIGFRFSFCVTDIFSKYAWVTSLKNPKESKLLMFFKKI